MASVAPMAGPITTSRSPEVRYAAECQATGSLEAAPRWNRRRVAPDNSGGGDDKFSTQQSDLRRQASRLLPSFNSRGAATGGKGQGFIARHGSERAQKIRIAVDDVKKAVAKTSGGGQRVLHPEKNRFLLRWDSVTSLALIWTATVTPFETGFLPTIVGAAAWGDKWFIANRCLDVIFGLDMGLQFFVAYQTGDRSGGRTWVVKHELVVKHYLRTWFPLDLLTVVVPCTFDVMLASGDSPQPQAAGEAGADDMAGRLGMLRVLRVLRLVKLVRLVKASRLFERWQASITLTHATQTVLKIVFLCVLSSHWFACVIALQAMLHQDINHTWLGEGAYGLCEPWTLRAKDHSSDSSPSSASRLLSEATSSEGYEACSGLTMASFYLASFTWSAMVITGTGGTDFYPSAASDGETLIVLMLILIGAFLWAFVLASFCDLATNSNPTLVAFRQQLDGLNVYIRMNALPKEMAQRMRSYMHQQRGVLLREDAIRTLPNLSPALQIEAVLYVHSHWLNLVWFIRELDAPVKVRLAMAMKPQVLAPGEVAPYRHLYVLVRGSVMYGRRVLTKGMAWGDDVILTEPTYFLPYLARALAYTDVTSITQEVLYEHVQPYPASTEKLRRSTIHLALRRHVVFHAREARKEASRQLVAGTFSGDFLDRMHEAGTSKKDVSKSQEQSMSIALELNKSDESARNRRHRDSDRDTAGVDASEFQSLRGEVSEVKSGIKQLKRELAAMRSGQEDLAKSVAAGADLMRELVNGAHRVGLFAPADDDEGA